MTIRTRRLKWQPIDDGGDTMLIPLTRGLFAIIDAPDFNLVSNFVWQAHPRVDGKGFYVVNGGRGGDRINMHRVIVGLTDKTLIVDHIDGDGLNNRRCNLRIGTQQQNSVNRRVTKRRYLQGTQPYRYGGWTAVIYHKRQRIHLGVFATEQQAHEAYLEEGRHLNGEWFSVSA